MSRPSPSASPATTVERADCQKQLDDVNKAIDDVKTGENVATDDYYRIPAIMQDLQSSFHLTWNGAGSWSGYTFTRTASIPNINGTITFTASLSIARIGDYKRMLTDYYNKCLSRGNIVSTDTLIVTINLHLLDHLTDEGQNLYKSFSDLVLYATGAAACSTSDLLLVIGSINASLDNIQRHLNKAYFDTWRYIQVRIGYWKAQVYRAKNLQEIVQDAYGRWRIAGKLDY